MIRTALAGIACVALLAGCSMVSPRVSHHRRGVVGGAESAREMGDPGEAGVQAAARPEREDMALSAVEDFLRRTEEYDWPSQTGPDTESRRSAIYQASRPPARDVKAERIESTEHTSKSATSMSSDGTARPGNAGDPLETSAAVVANTHVAIDDPEPLRPAPALPVLLSMSVHQAVKQAVEPREPPPSSATNKALDVQPDDDTISVDEFLDELDREAAGAKDFDSAWRAWLARVALKGMADVPESVAGLPSEAHRILSGLIRLIVSARAAARNPLLAGDEALKTADELRRLLADRADPTVSVVALCRKVVTFGVYEEMNSADFVAGQTLQTIVYSEIRNLRSESAADGQYRTLLATRLEVLTESGESVWQHEEPEIQDLCRRRRTDFFIAQRIALPATLGEGNYILKVFAEDRLSGKADEAAYRFRMYSPLSIAASG